MLALPIPHFTTVADEVSPSSRGEPNPSVIGSHEHCGKTFIMAKNDLGGGCAADDPIMATKLIAKDFLTRLPYQSPRTVPNHRLRREVTAEIVSWDAGLSWKLIEGVVESSCAIAESAFAHTTYEHQHLIAVYTACLTYADDLGYRKLEAIGQFAQRFTRGEPQLVPALSRLAVLLGTVHEYYPRISADAIIISTIDFFTACYIEITSKGDAISPLATKYPYYLRLKSGAAPGYAHFIFTKSWGDGAGTYYLQLLPELELLVIGINDILSLYKETLAGETDNYVHIRAMVERKSPTSVLRELVEENLEAVDKIEQLSAAQPGLRDMCLGFIVGYVEFHFNARWYRLHDLNVDL